jgi:uncharacterized Zn finger protein (UPF0148 family)
MSCCGNRIPVQQGTPCPKCGKFKSLATTTVRCPVCKTFFLPRRQK